MACFIEKELYVVSVASEAIELRGLPNGSASLNLEEAADKEEGVIGRGRCINPRSCLHRFMTSRSASACRLPIFGAIDRATSSELSCRW
jgi:hypothetical protein